MVGEPRDTILLGGIQFRGHHGDSPAEREIGGRFEVDVEMARDLRAAEKSDAVADTVDYFAVHRLVLQIGQGERCQMLESLAGKLAGAILERFDVQEVTLTVRKLMPPLEGIVAFAGVRITRRKGDYKSV